ERFLPAGIVGDVVEHVEGVHDVVAFAERDLADVAQDEAGLGEPLSEALNRGWSNIETGHACLSPQVIGGEEAGAASHISNVAARVEDGRARSPESLRLPVQPAAPDIMSNVRRNQEKDRATGTHPGSNRARGELEPRVVEPGDSTLSGRKPSRAGQMTEAMHA